jgi:hypothetical protein
VYKVKTKSTVTKVKHGRQVKTDAQCREQRKQQWHVVVNRREEHGQYITNQPIIMNQLIIIVFCKKYVVVHLLKKFHAFIEPDEP